MLRFPEPLILGMTWCEKPEWESFGAGGVRRTKKARANSIRVHTGLEMESGTD